MEENNNNIQNESVKLSLGTTVFIALLGIISFIGVIVWISLRIKGTL